MIRVIVTLIALYIILLIAKKSVHGLMEGIRAMTAGDFSKRVDIISDDEIGETILSLLFNKPAATFYICMRCR